MSKKITITRKIQILIDGEKQEIKDSKFTLYRWNEKVYRAANYTASHQYIQEKEKEFAYMNHDIKLKLANSEKDPDGVLNTSRTNTTYRVLSEKFKGDVPMAMISAMNNNVVKNFQAEKKEYFSGKRSLRTYKRNIPMPAPTQMLGDFTPTEDGNYRFQFFGIKLKTYFGRDKSGNKIIFDRALQGEYKLCDSSLQLDGKKIFLLAVFQFDSDKLKLGTAEMEAELSVDVPVVLKISNKTFNIGDKGEFLHRRIAIQQALRRQQIAARFNKGGKGIHKKIAGIERFKEKERHYIQTRQHQYSKKMIDFCLKFKCCKLVLKNQKQKEEEAKENPFLLRNWTYYGFIDKIKYKCNRVGIELVVEGEEVSAEVEAAVS